MQEVFEQVLTALGVLNFGVPLHSVEVALVIGKSSYRGGLGGGNHGETGRGGGNLVAMAHPHGLGLWLTAHEGVISLDGHIGG
ncbi:MAG: hypothetical protein RLZZ52_582, partial [Actinomycetota bacterium]